MGAVSLRQRRRHLCLPPVRLSLLVLAVAAPAVEAAALWLSGLGSDRALAAQVSAPSPWGEFHDLRWLLVLGDSWPAAVLEIAGIWLARSAFNTLLVHQAWPSTASSPPTDASEVAVPDRPPWLRLFVRELVLTAAVLFFLLPWTVLGFGILVVPISWLFFAALPPVFFISLVMSHGPATSGWWRRPPPLRSVGLIAVTFAGQTLAGSALQAAPAGAGIAIAAAAGLFNAWAWYQIVASVVKRPAPTRFLPLGPGVAVGMLAVAVIGTTVSFELHRAPAAPAGPVLSTAGPGPPVLIVGGFDSTLAGALPAPIPGSFDEVRFSYRGQSPEGEPLPYQASDTHQSIKTLVRLMAAQVQALHARTGQPVAVVAESEGSLIARAYMASASDPPVSHLVLLSPLDQPGRAFYPRSGRAGYGMIAGWGLSALSATLGHISPIQLSPGSPFLRSIVDHAGALRNLGSCPVPGVPEVLIEPLADAVVDPSGVSSRVHTIVLPAFHGGLLTNHRAQEDISLILSGHPVAGNSIFSGLEGAVRLAGSAWQVPALPISTYAKAPNDPSCAAMTGSIRKWIDSPPA